MAESHDSGAGQAYAVQELGARRFRPISKQRQQEQGRGGSQSRSHRNSSGAGSKRANTSALKW